MAAVLGVISKIDTRKTRFWKAGSRVSRQSDKSMCMRRKGVIARVSGLKEGILQT